MIFLGCADSVTDLRWLKAIENAIDASGGEWATDSSLTVAERQRALRRADIILLPVTAAAGHERDLAFYEGAAVGMGVPVLRIATRMHSKRNVPRWLHPYVVIPPERLTMLGKVVSSVRRERPDSDDSRAKAIRTSRTLHHRIAMWARETKRADRAETKRNIGAA